jgi:hypothetical protein
MFSAQLASHFDFRAGASFVVPIIAPSSFVVKVGLSYCCNV